MSRHSHEKKEEEESLEGGEGWGSKEEEGEWREEGEREEERRLGALGRQCGQSAGAARNTHTQQLADLFYKRNSHKDLAEYLYKKH